MEKDILEVQHNHLQNILKERDDEALDDVMKDFTVRYTYDAISLEGNNKIPFEDVKRLIDLKVLGSHSEREQKEVLNHVKAFEFIIDMVSKNIPMDEDVMKDIHEMVVDGIFQGGVYRNVNIQMMGSTHQPTDHAKVYDRMHKLFKEVSEINYKHPIDKAVHVHAGIAKIHPFLDANGRLARLVLNYYLMTAGYLPITIPVSDKDKYIDLLEIYKSEKNIQPLESYVKDLMTTRYEEVITALEV